MKLKFSIRSLATALCAAAALSSVSTAVLADPISVLNHSFENPVQSGPGYQAPPGITSWVTTGSEEAGVWNPAIFPGLPLSYFFSTALPDGSQIGYTNGGTIAQTLGTSYVADGSTYSLTVAFGVRLDDLAGKPRIPTNVTMQLYAGTTATIVATQAIDFSSITQGTFKDFTLSYSADSSSNGNAIGILFTSTGNQLDIDNVRLNNVPEPGTLILLGSALAGIGMARRRKQA